MSYKSLIIEQKEDFALILINRPDKGNSISDLLIKESIDFFSKAPSETGARIAIIKGVGGKYFSTGSDLEELAGGSIRDQREGFTRLALFYESIRRSRMISIASVNGLALGGGCGLAAVCDIAIASKTAKFGLPEINLGIAPLVVLLPVMRSIGSKRAFLLAARGESITAKEAFLRIGLISSLFEEERLDDEAGKLARELVNKSGIVLSLRKKRDAGS
jgi:enoyl-CoA hydratase